MKAFFSTKQLKKILSFFTLITLLFSQTYFFVQNTYAASPSDILITEVYYDVAAGYLENEGEWFELYNPTSTSISLSGWEISDQKNSGGSLILGNTYTFTGGVNIAPGQFLLVGNDATEFTNVFPGLSLDIDMEKIDAPDCKTDNECLQLNNGGGDSLTLTDDGGNIIDHMAWEGVDGFDVNADESFSACRRNLIDTDTDAEWANNCVPTPGTGTFISQFPGGVPIASLLWSKVDSETYSHGDTVTVLNDRSGNDRDGTNVGTPSFDTINTINFYPTASFDGSTDGFTFPEYSFPIDDKNYTMYSVFTSPLSQDNMTLQYVGRDSGMNNSTITYINSDGSTHDDFDNGAINLNSTPVGTIVANTPTIISYNYNSSIDTKSTFINAKSISTLTGIVDHNASNSPTSKRGIGFNADSNSNYFVGNIAEVLAYDSELDTISKQKIDSYLALKYGITLDQTTTTDYINSSGSVLWNSTINSIYTNNIIGVGQNNLSDLDQKISKSINASSILTLSTSSDFTSLNTDISRTSLTDGEFIIFGTDEASLSTQITELDTSLFKNRIVREWKVQNTGNVGEVFLKFDGFDDSVVLLTDSDGDFSEGATNKGFLNTDGSTSITLADGEYFTLATPIENNPPTDITLSGSTIDENNIIGDTIGNFTSTDLDTLDTHIYSLVAGTGSSDNGSFSLSGATLIAGKGFDYEVKNSYSIRIKTYDQNGGVFEKIFTITINDLDEIDPVVTLNGSSPESIYLNSTFTDTGATWTDNSDGTGSLLLASSGGVDNSTIGQYLLDYSYTDIAGNKHTVTRIVNVISGDTPIITLTGSGIITQEVGATYTDLGANYSDTEDGTGSIIGSGSVNISTVGNYIISYNYTDSSSNPAIQVTRTVVIEDTTDPVITLIGSGSITQEINTQYSDMGATPIDTEDGDVTPSITFTGSIDTTHPDFTLLGSLELSIVKGGEYVEQGYSCEDNSLTECIVTSSGSVDTSTIGIYEIEYTAKDVSGNTAEILTRKIEIFEEEVVAQEEVTQTRSGGGGGSVTHMDVCNNGGDMSGDYYDGECNSEELIQQTKKDEEVVKELKEELEEVAEQMSEKEVVAEQMSEEKIIELENSEAIIGEEIVISKEYSTENNFESCPIIQSLNNPEYISDNAEVFLDEQSISNKELVYKFNSLGIVTGTIEGNFESQRDVTRTEFLKILLISHCYDYSSLDSENFGYKIETFDNWQKRVIQKAESLGWIDGDFDTHSNEIFRPNDIISKAEALKILLNVAHLRSSKLEDLEYSDISIEWHKAYINEAQTLNILSPEEDKYIFNPDDGMKREDILELVKIVVGMY